MERFYFEYTIDEFKHTVEFKEDSVVIGDVVEQFKSFLRGLYSAKLVDNIKYLGPECK